jgi:cytochrome c peroxidase
MDKTSSDKGPDEGRFVVTHNKEDWGAFKTPTLRDVARTAPYMHDGSLKTLDDVVEFYDKGGIANRNLDEKLKPLHLTVDEKRALVEFMKALSGEGWEQMTAPATLPQ